MSRSRPFKDPDNPLKVLYIDLSGDTPLADKEVTALVCRLGMAVFEASALNEEIQAINHRLNASAEAKLRRTRGTDFR